MKPLIVYFSSKSGNTNRFVSHLGIAAKRIPISRREEMALLTEPYVLMCPTYADDNGAKAVPKQVIHFLNNPVNRKWLRGVIGTGNRNFGHMFAHAADVIAKKCNVPILYRLELSGTSDDIQNVKKGMEKLWESLNTETKMKQVRQ